MGLDGTNMYIVDTRRLQSDRSWGDLNSQRQRALLGINQYPSPLKSFDEYLLNELLWVYYLPLEAAVRALKPRKRTRLAPSACPTEKIKK